MENPSWASRINDRLQRIPRVVRHVLYGFAAVAVIVFIVFGILYAFGSPPDPCGGAHRSGDNCYTVTRNTTFANGTESCRQMGQGWQPASIHSKEENEAATAIVTQIQGGGAEVFIGGYQTGLGKALQWLDGTTADYTNLRWSAFRTGSIQCSILRPDGQWSYTESCKPACAHCTHDEDKKE